MPGQSGNAAGRPLAARQRIAERLLKDIEEVWQSCGKSVLERLARDEPKALAQIAYGMLDRNVLVKVEDNRTPGNLESIKELLDILEAAGVKDPEDLRARLATEIERSVSNPLAIEYSVDDKTNSDQ
jgi:hypothetical protein